MGAVRTMVSPEEAPILAIRRTLALRLDEPIPEVQVRLGTTRGTNALLTREGSALEWWTDFERTYASFASFSRRDAGTARRWREKFIPIVERILTPEAQAPPLPPDQRRALLSRSAEGRHLLEISQFSPREFVLREFEHPVIQAGLLFFNGLREVDRRSVHDRGWRAAARACERVLESKSGL